MTESTVSIRKLTHQAEDEVARALGNVRKKIRRATGEELEELKARRAELNEQLERFVSLNLQVMGDDPRVAEASEQLQEKTRQMHDAITEMRSVTATLNKVATVIGHANDVLGIVGRLVA